MAADTTLGSEISEISAVEDGEPVFKRFKKEYYGFRLQSSSVMVKENQLNDLEYQRIFTMNRVTLELFVQEVGPSFPVGSSSNGQNIHVRERILTFLYWIGSNVRYVDIKVKICLKNPSYN